jgi:glycosyltransferase involved in cell wall biosynthesis
LSVKITVVTPSYNQARFLDQTLRSVLSQRDQIHEFFVLDAGSNDGSADIIRRHAQQGGIDYWHSQKDKGQSDAIDQGFRRATGDVLCWLNSDDVFLPNVLAKVRAAFDRNPRWDALTGYLVRIDADSRILTMHRTPGESTRMALWGVHHVAQQTCFFKKSLYERVGGIDLSLHCLLDTEMWYRMFDSGATWGHVPEYLAAFRVHELAKGSSWDREYARENALISEKYPRYRTRRRQWLGMNYYRLTQVLSLRQVRATLETRRNRGRKLTDVFGDWPVPA